jgi:PhnB protein
MAAVKAIPEGYHTVTPYLTVDDPAQAIEFYKRAFGASEKARMNAPDGKVAHAEVQIGDSRIMLGNEIPEQGCLSPASLNGTPVSLYLYVEDVDAMFKRAVGAGAIAEMQVTDEFWGDRHGQVRDPFGHLWSLATHKQDVTQDKIRSRAPEFFAARP